MAVMPPNSSVEPATISNKVDNPAPSQATLSQPMKAATIMRAVPASNGPTTRLDLWLAKYSAMPMRSEEHTSELQSPDHLVCRLLLEKKKTKYDPSQYPAAALI